MKVYHVVMPDQKKYYLYEISSERVVQYNPSVVSVSEVLNTLENIRIPHLSEFYRLDMQRHLTEHTPGG
jgi:hypothetical protein